MYCWVARPAGAAVLDRPRGDRPALLRDDPVPAEEVLLAQLDAGILLRAQFAADSSLARKARTSSRNASSSGVNSSCIVTSPSPSRSVDPLRY